MIDQPNNTAADAADLTASSGEELAGKLIDAGVAYGIDLRFEQSRHSQVLDEMTSNYRAAIRPVLVELARRGSEAQRRAKA